MNKEPEINPYQLIAVIVRIKLLPILLLYLIKYHI